MSVQRFINENIPVMSDDSPPEEQFLVIEAWTHSDFLCNGLQDDLYKMYNVKTSKELWDDLEKKYQNRGRRNEEVHSDKVSRL